MSASVIKVQNLSKKYTLGQTHANLLSERMGNGLRSVFGRIFRNGSSNLKPDTSNLTPNKDFWALKDVSFEVGQGGVLGIIGRNGAGKSTLLKILSRITTPTSGTVELYGRVASLLEVGTGFHPELTGRENIFLNGAILGMNRAEIKRKFDEIVAFAEVEKFIDTPVKRYSSGMYVRLAFAVAAHLEPEILIIDEVLAVGDAQFQKKCLGKMGDVSSAKGKTVLFVSHNISAISQICLNAILLHNGNLVMHGRTKDVVDYYLEASFETNRRIADRILTTDAHNDGVAITSLHLESTYEIPISLIDIYSDFIITASCVAQKEIPDLDISIWVENEFGIVAFSAHRSDHMKTAALEKSGVKYKFKVLVPSLFLTPGRYYISLMIHVPLKKVYCAVERGVAITIEDSGLLTWRNLQPNYRGIVFPRLQWSEETL
jgi:lipopolysaccharide transport system ATP-binding protein